MIQTLICLLESVKSIVGRGVNTCLLSGEVSWLYLWKISAMAFLLLFVG